MKEYFWTPVWLSLLRVNLPHLRDKEMWTNFLTWKTKIRIEFFILKEFWIMIYRKMRWKRNFRKPNCQEIFKKCKVRIVWNCRKPQGRQWRLRWKCIIGCMGMRKALIEISLCRWRSTRKWWWMSKSTVVFSEKLGKSKFLISYPPTPTPKSLALFIKSLYVFNLVEKIILIERG